MSARHDLGEIIWETSRGDEQSISATGANIVADAILAAGFGAVVEAKAAALEEAAAEIDRLRVIGKTPYAECTQSESEAFLQFAEVKPEAWLRARANAMRGEA